MWFWLSFILLGMAVYIPVGTIIWLIIISPLSKYLENKHLNNLADATIIGGFLLLVLAALLTHGGFFGWYDKLEKPDKIIISVDKEVTNDFYRYQEENDEIYITLADKVFSEYTESHLTDNDGYIRFDVSNKNAKKDRANLVWTVEVNGKEYERDNLPAGTELHFFSDSFSLNTGENIVTVKAKNNIGETTQRLHITKLSTETECTKSENAENSICQQISAKNSADAKKKAASESKNSSLVNNSSKSSSGSQSSSSSSSSCDYYEYGQCWDDVVDQAWEDGYMDAYYGGHSYYRDCDGICADIYEEAYDKGNYYGTLEYGEK